MSRKLALSMIVRDAAQDLPACLASVRGVVDQAVIADTGSQDGSPALARDWGAEVIEIPWRDDFAEARNAALAACQADWILMLDADERLDPASGAQLRRLVDSPRGLPGYEATIRNYVPSLAMHLHAAAAQPNDRRLPEADPFPAYVEHQNVRLFRRLPEIYFTGRVHETVARSIEDLGRPIGPPSFLVHHFGLVAAPEARRRKDLYYRELGRRKIAERPADPRSFFELGAEELEHFGDAARALKLLQRACRIAPDFWLAWFFRGQAELRLGHPSRALAAFHTARGGVSGALLEAAAGEAHYAEGDFAAAAQCFRRALKWQPASADLASRLGLCELRQGDAEAGLKRLRRAARADPAHPGLQDRLILALAWLGQPGEAAQAAEAWLAHAPAPSAKAFLRAASLRGRAQQWPEAAAALRRGLARFPAEPSLLAAWSEVRPHLSLGPSAETPSQSLGLAPAGPPVPKT